MAKLPDLSKLSIDELKSVIRDAEKTIEKKAKEELKAARKAAEEAAKKHGFSLDEITGGQTASKSRGKAKAPAKFANPDDPSQTWSGRGRQPDWFKAATDSGKSREDLAI